MKNAEYLELPVRGCLELPAVVRADGLDLESSEDDIVCLYSSPAQISCRQLFSVTWAPLNGLYPSSMSLA